MTALDQIRQLWRHARWADAELLRALRNAPAPAPRALREFTHLLAAEEVWLARIEQRAPRSTLWPELSVDAAAALGAATDDGYARVLARLTEEQLDDAVPYTNSAGQPFATSVGDILVHVALHGQYHRGKVNLLLRQGGTEPAPVDYIAFVRGVPAVRAAAPSADARSP